MPEAGPSLTHLDAQGARPVARTHPREAMPIVSPGQFGPTTRRIRGNGSSLPCGRLTIVTEAMSRTPSELDYRLIVEAAQEGVWLMAADARTVYVNPSMARLLGDTGERLVGVSLFEFVSDEWLPVARRAFEQRGLPGTARYQLKLKRRDGSEVWVAMSSQTIAQPESSPGADALAIVIDIGEQREREAQTMVYDRLVAAGALAAGVAHEINNPLASVIANLELALPGMDTLQADFGDTSRFASLREQVHEARDAARRAQAFIKHLQIFARSQDHARGPVDVRRVLESALHMASDEVHKRAKVVKDYADVPLVDADESHLAQVFLNLIVNAAQAIPRGRADGNEIRIACAVAPDQRVVISISDTGVGMSAEVQQRLFTPFFSTKPVGTGSGLGLAICHRIVGALSGQISVESQAGRGTTFRVSLPFAQTAFAQAAFAQAAFAKTAPVVATVQLSGEPAVAHRGRVLVVDDEVMMTKVISRTLNREHDVVTTTLAEDALRMIAQGERFDVILCDLMMPRITGMDFHSELLRKAPEQAQRIIFLTGGAFTPHMRSFLDKVENLCLEKPFEPNALRGIVNRRVAVK